MELLSLSSTSPSPYPQTSLNLRHSLSKPNSFSLRPHAPSPSPIKRSISTSPKTLAGAGLGLNVDHQPNSLSVLLSSASQSPESAARDASADVMGLLLRERIVFLWTSIDDEVADAVVSQLLLLDAHDHTKDIRLFINSYGGSMSDALAIYDVMKLVRADVSTIALGISASTASLVLAGGTKGKRYAMPNTRIMIHQPGGGTSGTVRTVETQAKEIIYQKKHMATILSECSGRSFDEVEKYIDRERFFSPIEAVEYGLIDGVIDRNSILPLEPVPEMVTPTLVERLMGESSEEFLNPDIPDDEIY